MSKQETLERRVVTLTEVEVRNEDGDAGAITGYAAVYDTWSGDLGGFKEIIRPGFFRSALQNSDVRALWNHNSDLILGRTRAGTLAITDDSRGLHTVTQPPDTQWGRDAVVSIARGDVDQMSFAFTVHEEGQRWTRDDESGMMKRELLPDGCAELFDISPVTYPAYEATRVSVRTKEQVEALQQELDAHVPDNSAENDAGQAERARKRQQLDIRLRR